MNKLFLDFHIIQTVPPSCVNRDDTGSPKTAIYGGVRRARVSSQSWKRAMRKMFENHFKADELGVRTLKVVEMVADKIKMLDPAKSVDEATKLAVNVLKEAGVETKEEKVKNKKTKDGEGEETSEIKAKALFFMSAKQAENLANLALSGNYDKKSAKAALKASQGVDIALFGRMLANDPELNCDAAAQVAHGISTHAVTNEYDYFTAMDDLQDVQKEDDAGARMIGTVEFNSATLYRYANIAVHELYTELGENPAVLGKAVAEFARAFISSMPSGKQNTFANYTVPDAVMVSLRNDRPINLAGAFEEPVKKVAEGGYKTNSVEALIKYAKEVYNDFADKPAKAYVIGPNLNEMGEKVNFAELLTCLDNDMLQFSKNE